MIGIFCGGVLLGIALLCFVRGRANYKIFRECRTDTAVSALMVSLVDAQVSARQAADAKVTAVFLFAVAVIAVFFGIRLIFHI